MSTKAKPVHALLATLVAVAILAPQAGRARGQDASPSHAPSFAPPAAQAAPAMRLGWSPPELQDPVVVPVAADAGDAVIKMDTHRDYVIQMPHAPVLRGLTLMGGRNVILIGGEIAIPWQGAAPSIADRTGLKIKGATGTVHIEGLLLHGDDISEGIQIEAPQATVQLQNIGIFNVHARDNANFSDNHPDLIQTYGNVRELRIDRMTGSTDYQGLYFQTKYHGPHGPIHITRANIIGEPTARKLIWFEVEPHAGAVVLEDVWIDVPAEKRLANAVWPMLWGDFPAQAQLGFTEDGIEFAAWPAEMSPSVAGRVYEGAPPGGNFVAPADIGIGYESPGYDDAPAGQQDDVPPGEPGQAGDRLYIPFLPSN